jgi:hypothetical protein
MVMSRKASSSKLAACEVCQGTNLVRRITTYSVHLTGPLEGKQIRAYAEVSEFLGHGLLNILKSRSLQTGSDTPFSGLLVCFFGIGGCP